jgi:hypothetical protein
MAKLTPYALKNSRTNTVVPGSLILANNLPKSGEWFPVVEGIERNTTNPVDYDNTVKLSYPGAVNVQRFGEYAKAFIQEQGYSPDNIVLSDSICSDDVDGPIYSDISNIGQTPASQNQFLGAFMAGGLAGYPHTGVLGIQAWGSHVTTITDGGLFMVNTPHIGISRSGNVGRIWRRGKTEVQSLTDNTCGAVATAVNWVASNIVAPVAANFPNDYQNYVLCNILFSFKAALAALPTYGEKMVFATEKIRLSGDSFLTGGSGIIGANVGAGVDVFYCTGIFINTDDGYNAYISVTAFKKYNSVGGWVDLTTEFLQNL